MPITLRDDVGPGFLALLGSVGVQHLTPFQQTLQLYPDNLRAIMVPFSSLVVGAAVLATSVRYAGKSTHDLRGLILRDFALLLAAVTILVFLTLLFVVNIDAPADPDRDDYSFVIAGQERLQECGCNKSETISRCLRSLDERQDILVCWGRWRVVMVETLIVIVYASIGLLLGRLGGLVRIAGHNSASGV